MQTVALAQNETGVSKELVLDLSGSTTNFKVRWGPCLGLNPPNSLIQISQAPYPVTVAGKGSSVKD